MEDPLVSIAIPCYNHESYIQDCIKSIIDQNYSNIELIIIDDGSIDRSVSKIEEMVDACTKRFKRFEFRSRKNVGLSATLNEAVEWCVGEYYCTIASDDFMRPSKTSIQVQYLKAHPLCAAVFGGIDIVDIKGNVVKQLPGIEKSYSFKDVFLHQHDLPAATQMIRLASLKEVGGFRPDIVLEDWYMWLQLTRSGKTVDRIGVVISAYRRHEENFSKKINVMSAGRAKVASLFSDHSLYNRAMANALLVDAASLQIYDKKASFLHAKKAWQYSKKDFFSAQFLKYLIKSILPKRTLLKYFGH